MALFDQIMGAIANPNQQANPDQLGSILGGVQQLTNQGVDASTSQTVMSMVGGHVRSALQQQQAQNGSGHVENLVNQFSGLGANPTAVQALFSPNQQTQIANEIAQRTGLQAGQVQGLLAIAVPIVLQLLQTGSHTQGNPGGNTVLNSFLDSNNDGSVDIGDAIGLAGRFLQR